MKIERKVKQTECFLTTDGQEFQNLANAESHQKFVDRKGIATELEQYIHDIYGVPTQEEIDKAFEEEDNWAYAETLEEKRNEILYNDLIGVYIDWDVDEIAEILIDTWQSFGEEKINHFFGFIKERLNK